MSNPFFPKNLGKKKKGKKAKWYPCHNLILIISYYIKNKLVYCWEGEMSTTQKIAEIEAEMERTQKNKATSYHVGLLKAKLAKLKR